MEDYSLKFGVKPNHAGKYDLLNFSRFFSIFALFANYRNTFKNY